MLLAFGEIALRHDHLLLYGSLEQVIEDVLVIPCVLRGLELRLDGCQRLLRHVGTGSQDGDQLAIPHHLHAGIFSAALVSTDFRVAPCAGGRRMRGKQHSRKGEIGGVLGLTGDLQSGVLAPGRLAHDLVVVEAAFNGTFSRCRSMRFPPTSSA